MTLAFYIFLQSYHTCIHTWYDLYNIVRNNKYISYNLIHVWNIISTSTRASHSCQRIMFHTFYIHLHLGYLLDLLSRTLCADLRCTTGKDHTQSLGAFCLLDGTHLKTQLLDWWCWSDGQRNTPKFMKNNGHDLRVFIYIISRNAHSSILSRRSETWDFTCCSLFPFQAHRTSNWHLTRIPPPNFQSCRCGRLLHPQ